jgi:glycerophosphoryl diester phosphodiesterase
MPSLSIPTPVIVHHMAALDDSGAPPNSLAALQACLQDQAVFVEVDVTALAHDDYLLVHDDVLESETSGHGAVASCTVAQARELSIQWRGEITAHRVPLLSEVVDLFLHAPAPTRLQLDFKNVIPLPDDEPLQRLIRLIAPLGERVLVSSGADWQLRKLRKLAPWLHLGFDIMFYIDWEPNGKTRDPRAFPKQRGAYGYYDDHMLASARYWSIAEYLRDRCESFAGLVPDVSVFYVDHRLLAQSLTDGFNWAEALHERGIKLDAWTMDVTNPSAVQNARRLREAGVDLFTTNTPHALAQLLDIQKVLPSK